MKLVQSLGSAIAKSGVSSSICNSGSDVAQAFRFKCKPKVATQVIASKVRRNNDKIKFLEENRQLVGKGSMFERRTVQDYLAPLNEHRLTRHRIENRYDATIAQRNHRLLKKIQDSEDAGTLFFNQFHQYVVQMISLLILLTPKKINVEHNILSFQGEKFTELPPIPNFKQSPDQFEAYVSMLCHSKFFYKKSSSMNGIVSKILRNLMHPSNVNTLGLKSVNCFNDVILFYSERFEFASCREFYAQMKIEGVKPNSKTFNLLIRGVLKNSHLRKRTSSFDDLIFFLKQMRQHQIHADTITWTTCYNLLLDDISRDLYMSKMMECSVPITGPFILAVLKNASLTASQTLRFLSDHSVPLTLDLFNVCVSKLVEEEKFEVAWAFMKHVHSNGNVRIDFSSLNIFLRKFAEAGRLDMALLTYNTAISDYTMKPNLHTFDMLFKALVRNGYTDNFNGVFQYLKQKLITHTNSVNVFSYWRMKAHAMAKFNIKKRHDDKEFMHLKNMLDALKFDGRGMKWNCWRDYGKSMRKSLRLLGTIPPNMKEKSGRTKFDTSESTIIKKRAFRKRIRFLAVQNAMIKRIPYAKDRYGALKLELEERGLLKS
ncbi:LAMI_0F12816g1_1 [Lachancea mirantina]|uniref:LAMI_0F12816g1_1 n=1 Tax=Lachancea mirantina TaxID=1230905 RepID=A0A1G4K3F3_9SACH|nr:LAMI_0F12816g1_1 [Lachancea mirantina]